MTSSQQALPQVALLVDTATQWGRELIEGIASYANQYGPWHLLVQPRDRDNPMQLPKDWDGDGVIARVSSQKQAAELLAKKLPVVNVSGIELPGVSFPRVTTDHQAIVELAFEYFQSHGFRRFAYVGPINRPYVKRLADTFEELATRAEGTLDRFDYAIESMAGQRWQHQQQRLAHWLEAVEKPIAVFCWGTDASCQLLHLCHRHGIPVPDEVSVLAGDNDNLLAKTTIPSMSAVLTPSAQIGFCAAGRLHRMMCGEKVILKPELIAPIEIISRRSTEVLAIEDSELLAAVRHLRQHAFSELTIQTVADAVPMTRRSLEIKFKARFGRTPLAELRRLRIGRAKELLATTDLPMPRVAAACGFGSPQWMATVFKTEMKVTPLEYRSTTRAR